MDIPEHHDEDELRSDHEHLAAEHVALLEQALIEQFPEASRLRFSATVDGKFLTVSDLLNAQGEMLLERAGKVLAVDDIAVTTGGEPRGVQVTVEDLLARALLVFPYPITAMPGVVVENQDTYLLELTGR